MDFYQEGRKLAKSISLYNRFLVLTKIHKFDSFDDFYTYVSSFIPSEYTFKFKSISDKYEFLFGFISGISYYTRSDVINEIREIFSELGITGVTNPWDYYYAATSFHHTRDNKNRVFINLKPRRGTAAKHTSRASKVSLEEAKKLVSRLNELVKLYYATEKRRALFFEKVG